MKNVSFVWKASPQDRTYITLTLQSSPTGNLVAIVGPVGSGKSTFLKGLAGETPVLQGELFIKYRDLAFCEQTPWLASRTIRDNIIGETSLSEFDAKWYSTVVTAIELDLDLKRMPAGHKTLVGSNGAKVSGGQKQRIVSSHDSIMIPVGLEYSNQTRTLMAYFYRSRLSREPSMLANISPVLMMS